MKCHGNTMFSLDSALCEWEQIFHRELYAAFRHNIWSTGNNPKPKSIDFDRLSRTTIMPSFKSFRSGVFVLSF